MLQYQRQRADSLHIDSRGRSNVERTVGRSIDTGDPDGALRILFVGAYVPATRGSYSASAELGARLATDGAHVIFTSRVAQRVLRAADMSVSAWRNRRAYDVAVVDVYSGAAFRWAEWVAAVLRAAHRPYVLTLHGGNLPAFAARSPARVARLLRGAAAVTAPSHYLADAMHRFRSDVRVLPNPIDVARYRFEERSRVSPRLVWLRAFHTIYQPELAVRAVAELARDWPRVELIMVGPDKDGSRARAAEEAAHLGVADRIRFVDGVAKGEVPRWLASGDIFLNTATIDNTPVSVLEAMATGLCVVSTKVGGVTHLIEDELDGLLVPVGDATAMAAAVRRILVGRALARSLSRNARAKATQHDWKLVLPRWTTLLTQVATTGTADG